MTPPTRTKQDKPEPAMKGDQVRALLKASGLTAAEASRRLKRTPNTLTNWAKDGCDATAAHALSALAAGLPVWTEEKGAAFKAIRGVGDALNING